MEFILERPDLILDVVIEHIYITIVAVFGATLIGVTLGVLITRARAFYEPVLTLAGIIYTIPSLAMFVLMIPILGIGFESGVVALILYSLLIVIRNTAVGIDGVDPNIREAARGMGMTSLSAKSLVWALITLLGIVCIVVGLGYLLALAGDLPPALQSLTLYNVPQSTHAVFLFLLGALAALVAGVPPLREHEELDPRTRAISIALVIVGIFSLILSFANLLIAEPPELIALAFLPAVALALIYLAAGLGGLVIGGRLLRRDLNASILFQIELPLAMPVIFAGIRIASVSAISIATIAAFIGAGGIGDLIFQGISSQRSDKIVAGAIAASVLAIGAEILLQQVEKGSIPGLTGQFKTLGESVADFWDYLRTHPDIVSLIGALLLVVGYFGAVWVSPYADVLAEDADAQTALAEADYSVHMTGADLANLQSDAPVRQSLELLPWVAGAAVVLAAGNMFFWSAENRAAAESLLLCGMFALFPLAHFYFEVQRAVGELGTFSDLFLVIRNDLNSVAGIRVSPRIDSLTVQSGFTLALLGAGLVVIGAYLKSLWFRQRRRAMEEQSI